MNTAFAAVLLAASLAGVPVPATAHADCGDPERSPCAGPVPTIDQVAAAMTELTDTGANKNSIVTPGLNAEETQTINDHLSQMDARGLLPYNFVVTNIEPAPNNFAGATVTVTGSFNQASAPQPMVLVDQGGRWLITHDTAMTALENFWYNTNRQQQYCARFWRIEGRC